MLLQCSSLVCNPKCGRSWELTIFTKSSEAVARRCSVKEVLLEIFPKFTGKQLYQSLFFKKVAGLNFIKKETLAQVFSSEFCEISKSSFSYRIPLVAASEYPIKDV